MRHLVTLAQEALTLGETCVLCTVVRIDGSGYGQPGARLLVTESGERSGYISGGCLEKDLLRQVWSRTDAGPALLAFDTRGNAVNPSRYQTGCEGIVYVLCQRLYSTVDSAYRVLEASQLAGKFLRMGTVYRSESRDVQIGDVWIDPPETTERNDRRPASPLTERLPTATVNRTIEYRGSDGGRIEAAIEILKPPLQLVILGAGDDVQPLVSAADLQGWNVTVMGRRPELANPTRFPGANVQCGPWDEVAELVPLRPETAVVMMTHDLEADVLLLPRLLESPTQSIGILGPKRRLGRLLFALHQRGRTVSPQEAERLRSPIGLDIGAATPSEVAASIVAELIALAQGRQGGLLHHQSHPLHHRADHQVIAPPSHPLVPSEIISTEDSCRAEPCSLD